MNDNDLTALTTQATEAVRAAYEAGYKAGHEAAIQAVMQAAQHSSQSFMWSGVPPSDHEVNFASAHGHPAISGTTQVGSGIAGQSVYGLSSATEIPKTASGRAAPGAIKRLVYDFVATAGRPVTEYDFAGRYPNVGRPSRYMAFRSLSGDGAIAKQGRTWVLAEKARNPDAATSGSQQPQPLGGTGNAPA